MPEIEVPDGITPLIGYRAWVAVTDEVGRPVLRSIYRQIEWPADCPLEASCLGPHNPRQAAAHGNPAPHRECSCGIYCLKSPDLGKWCTRQPRAVTPGFLVLGLVTGWGHYMEGRNGYRVQYAKPSALLERPVLPPPWPGDQGSAVGFYPPKSRVAHWMREAGERYRIHLLTDWRALAS